MTMLSNTPHAATASIRREIGYLLSRLGRLVNRWIAAMIAHRERQADIAVLRNLGDRELKDIGIRRGDIPDGLARAERARMRMQQPVKRHHPDNGR